MPGVCIVHFRQWEPQMVSEPWVEVLILREVGLDGESGGRRMAKRLLQCSHCKKVLLVSRPASLGTVKGIDLGLPATQVKYSDLRRSKAPPWRVTVPRRGHPKSSQMLKTNTFLKTIQTCKELNVKNKKQEKISNFIQHCYVSDTLQHL